MTRRYGKLSGRPRRNRSDPYNELRTTRQADADALDGAVTGLLFDYKRGEPARVRSPRGATWEPKRRPMESREGVKD